MNSQKSQKGRLTAAFQVEEKVGHRQAVGKKTFHWGQQQFGGSGSAHLRDRGAEHLSRRTNQAILKGPERPGSKSGGDQ